MNPSKHIERLFNQYLPAPFTIAVLLTFLTLLLAVFFTNDGSGFGYITNIFKYWENGIWNNSLLVFSYQMILILVLGHVLVLSTPFSILISKLTSKISTQSQAVVILSITSLLAAFFNWGLGLIFGAIFARKIAEHCFQKGIPLNYPLLGAAGYVGLMVWHGGISGSAPIKAAEHMHLKTIMSGIDSEAVIPYLPQSIGFDLTIFSFSNLLTFAILLLVIPIAFWKLSKTTKPTGIRKLNHHYNEVQRSSNSLAEKLNSSRFISTTFAVVMLFAFIISYSDALIRLQITPNMLNLFMLGAALLCHTNINSFLGALREAVSGSTGILIQFPLYFGILGILKNSGLISQFSTFFISISSETTLPIFTFLSAAVVNVFIPSGGGQWAVQGPIIIDAAVQLGVPVEKIIMSLAYGDQLTNMLQPFWALPLLAITKLKAKEILPYSVFMMLIAFVVFVASLLFF